jgi:hypothetical protein
MKLVATLEDDDDVQSVYANFEVDDEQHSPGSARREQIKHDCGRHCWRRPEISSRRQLRFGNGWVSLDFGEGKLSR